MRVSSLARIASHINKLQIVSRSNASFIRQLSDYPKHYILNLPALSPTMETGNLISWEVREGDKIDEGEVLAQIETDKANIGFEVVDGGYVAKFLVEAGTKSIQLGTPICILVDSPEDVDRFKDFSSSKIEQPATKEVVIEEKAPLNTPTITPTDPMVISKALMPHYYLTSSINFTRSNDLTTSVPSISRMAVIVKAAAMALQNIPDVNSCWADSVIRRYNQIAIKVTNYNAKIYNIVNAQSKSLQQISKELENEGSHNLDSTFTIRNCPGSTSCAAIIDPKQAAVLCLGDSQSTAVPCSKNLFKMCDVSTVTLSCDHRVVDGATGAEWLQHFKKLVNHPALMS